jgi:hypothetical protein
MARPVVVTDVTAAAGAGFGPVENHGAGTYSGKADTVKSQKPETEPCRSYWSDRSIFAVTISPTRSGRRLER